MFNVEENIGRYSTPAQSDPHELAPEAPRKLQVYESLDKVLASRPFRNSAQCSALLRYIVEHTLRGEDNLLRERVIGSDVFGRAADYETDDDPVVRLRASELRKRLAQYHQEEPEEPEVHITVPPGGYRALFKLRAASAMPDRPAAAAQVDDPEPVTPRLTESIAPAPHRPGLSRRHLIAAAIVLCLLAACGWAVVAHRASSDRRRAFWQPLLSGQEITLSFADYNQQDLVAADWAKRTRDVIDGRRTTSRDHAQSDQSLPFVPYIDLLAASQIVHWLGEQKRAIFPERSTAVTVDELRQRPAILIGTFDNDWTLLLTSKLRYHVQVDPVTQQEWVEDATRPGDRRWSAAGDLAYSASSTDYAIITRAYLPQTGQWLVSLGGLGMHGTQAAAEVLTEPDLSKLLPSSVRSQSNLQIVLRTTVINGHSGNPEVIASTTW